MTDDLLRLAIARAVVGVDFDHWSVLRPLTQASAITKADAILVALKDNGYKVVKNA